MTRCFAYRPQGGVTVALLVVVFILPGHLAAQNCNSSSANSNCTSTSSEGIVLAEIRWDYVSGPMVAMIFLFVVLVVALLCHYVPWVTTVLPETCLLILLGLAVAAVIYAVGSLDRLESLDSRGFLLFILPPIVLDAAYALNSRIFAENLILILVHAALGTLINFAIIGPALYGLALTGMMGNINLSFLDALLFASFLVAVDPVAVIAIFKDVGVNDRLYFAVFGESLLNDAITLVLYNMMTQFLLLPSVPPTQIAMGVALFFVDSFGGFALGLGVGLISALLTKVTYKRTHIEPLLLLILAYISYLLGELFNWSAIIALTTCGIVQAQLCFPNITYNSQLILTSIASILGSALEAVVFLFLGAELMRSGTFDWNVVFIVMTVVLCLVARAVSIFGLTGLANCWRKLDKISLREQFIMWFGGLRGALAFALCSTLDTTYAFRSLFLPTTLVVIMFTVFIQGTLMRPMVKLCKIEMKSQEAEKLLEILANDVTDHMMTGIELIIDHRDINYITDEIYRALNVVKRFLTHYSSQAMNLIEVLEVSAYEKVGTIRNKTHPTICHACNMPCARLSASNSVDVEATRIDLDDLSSGAEEDKQIVHVKQNGNASCVNGAAKYDDNDNIINDDASSSTSVDINNKL